MRMDVDTLDQDDLRREGGEEMEGMSLMVPRFSRKGKLFAGESAFSFWIRTTSASFCASSSTFHHPSSALSHSSLSRFPVMHREGHN
jgi:hypothetical protein